MRQPAWLETDDGSYVIRVSRRIDAPADSVWALVRDPARYAHWSSTLRAQVDQLVPGKEIALSIRLFGPVLPWTHSLEVVEVVDEEARAVAWSRDFALGQQSHRFQVVTPQGDSCRYLTALQLSPLLAAAIRVTLQQRLRRAFERIAEELAAAAER